MTESEYNKLTQDIKALLEERCDKTEQGFVFNFKSETTEDD